MLPWFAVEIEGGGGGLWRYAGGLGFKSFKFRM